MEEPRRLSASGVRLVGVRVGVVVLLGGSFVLLVPVGRCGPQAGWVGAAGDPVDVA